MDLHTEKMRQSMDLMRKDIDKKLKIYKKYAKLLQTDNPYKFGLYISEMTAEISDMVDNMENAMVRIHNI